MANREGLGRIRHLDTQSLWLQAALRERRLGLGKVPGAENPADLMTKWVDAKLLDHHLTIMGLAATVGRHELAPQVAQNVAIDVAMNVEDAKVDVAMSAEDVKVEMEVELELSISHSQTQVGANCAAQSQVCLQTVLNRRGRRGDEGMGMQARSIKAQRVQSFWSLFCIAI